MCSSRADPRPARRVLVSIALAAASFTGCDSGRAVIGARPLQPYAYTLIDSVRVDVDGDGAQESVELLATVERGAGGALLWEDGHHWAVVVRADTLAYPLVERFLPWGSAELLALEEEPGGRPAIVVLTRAGPSCPRAGAALALTVEKFAYAADGAGFVREAVVEAAGTAVCRAFREGSR